LSVTGNLNSECNIKGYTNVFVLGYNGVLNSRLSVTCYLNSECNVKGYTNGILTET